MDMTYSKKTWIASAMNGGNNWMITNSGAPFIIFVTIKLRKYANPEQRDIMMYPKTDQLSIIASDKFS
jgi:hypothetical protein